VSNSAQPGRVPALRLRRAREILSEASAPETWENAMATLAGQRAQFTWALNQYNLSEDPQTRAKFAKTMAKYIAAAPENGFTVDEVTQGQIYPSSE
jgi:hypothetical protein